MICVKIKARVHKTTEQLHSMKDIDVILSFFAE